MRNGEGEQRRFQYDGRGLLIQETSPEETVHYRYDAVGRLTEVTSSVSHVQLEYDLRDRVVGWSMSEQMKAELVCDALKMTLWRRKMPRGVIVHSGRGSQYCSHVYQSVIGDNKLRCSMSAKGCCYDNACAESLFLSLKVDYPRGTVQRARGDEFGGI